MDGGEPPLFEAVENSDPQTLEGAVQPMEGALGGQPSARLHVRRARDRLLPCADPDAPLLPSTGVVEVQSAPQQDDELKGEYTVSAAGVRCANHQPTVLRCVTGGAAVALTACTPVCCVPCCLSSGPWRTCPQLDPTRSTRQSLRLAPTCGACSCVGSGEACARGDVPAWACGVHACQPRASCLHAWSCAHGLRAHPSHTPRSDRSPLPCTPRCAPSCARAACAATTQAPAADHKELDAQ
jgi:hypothetical protein